MKDSSPTLYVAYGLFATASLLIVVNMVPSLNVFGGAASKKQPYSVLAVNAPKPSDKPEQRAGLRSGKIDHDSTASIPSGRTVGTVDAVSDENAVRVVVRPFQHVTLGSELNARIAKMPFKEGERFKTGDVLVSFDCSRTEAELASATAVHNGHKNAYSNVAEMQKYKAAGTFSVRQAKFEMEKSGADVRSLEAKRASCKIVAPFSGRVVDKMVQAYEVVSSNQPLLKIVDDSRPELDLMVPSRWLNWLKPGSPFAVQIDETGETYNAIVGQIGGAVDPVSQSVRLTADIPAPSTTILSGMSGTATFAGEKK